jgi:hypothetical protein
MPPVYVIQSAAYPERLILLYHFQITASSRVVCGPFDDGDLAYDILDEIGSLNNDLLNLLASPSDD